MAPKTFSAPNEINYKPIIDAIETLLPNQDSAEIAKKWGEGLLVAKTENIEVKRFTIKVGLYQLISYLQFFEGKVISFYLPLPSFFLHDFFHKELLAKLGPQDEYGRKDSTARYLWNNKLGAKHIYEGACTIYCFPIFYSAVLDPFPKGAESAMALIDQLQMAAP